MCDDEVIRTKHLPYVLAAFQCITARILLQLKPIMKCVLSKIYYLIVIVCVFARLSIVVIWRMLRTWLTMRALKSKHTWCIVSVLVIWRLRRQTTINLWALCFALICQQHKTQDTHRATFARHHGSMTIEVVSISNLYKMILFALPSYTKSSQLQAL